MNSAKFNKRRQPNTQYVLALSYGKDSLACLEAIKQLGYPLDKIVHAEVWATDDIPADLPPMVEFKAYADKIIKERYGIEVEHVCAMCTEDKKYKGNFTNPPIGVGGGYKFTYEDMFYRHLDNGKYIGNIKGFPMATGQWCQKLKLKAVKELQADIPRPVLQTDKVRQDIIGTERGGEQRIPDKTEPVLHKRLQASGNATSGASQTEQDGCNGVRDTSKSIRKQSGFQTCPEARGAK